MGALAAGTFGLPRLLDGRLGAKERLGKAPMCFRGPVLMVPIGACRVGTDREGDAAMLKRRTIRRALAVLTVSMVGLAPAVAFAPSAHAVTSALTATAPHPFGEVPVGQIWVQNVVVTNTGGATLQINPSMSGSATSLDFLVEPAYPATATSCLSIVNNTRVSASIPAGATCTLGIYFLPTHFGARSTTLTVVDNTGGSFSLNVSGAGGAGYYLAGDSAQWTTFGVADEDLEGSAVAVSAPVVGIAGTRFGDGFWLDAADGGVFTAGSAGFFGSMGGRHLNKPIVEDGRHTHRWGPWLVASDGGIFTFGNAGFFGSTGNVHLNKPIVGMARTPSGRGYWLVASDGGIFTFGDAGFFGSTGNVHLNKPIVGMAATPSGRGSWLVASDGGIFTFGDAGFFGSTGNVNLVQPIVGMAPSPLGTGYWLVASDGGIFTFNVPFEGDTGGEGVTTIGMAPSTAALYEPLLSAPASNGGQAGEAAILAGVTSWPRPPVELWPNHPPLGSTVTAKRRARRIGLRLRGDVPLAVGAVATGTDEAGMLQRLKTSMITASDGSIRVQPRGHPRTAESVGCERACLVGPPTWSRPGAGPRTQVNNEPQWCPVRRWLPTCEQESAGLRPGDPGDSGPRLTRRRHQRRSPRARLLPACFAPARRSGRPRRGASPVSSRPAIHQQSNGQAGSTPTIFF